MRRDLRLVLAALAAVLLLAACGSGDSVAALPDLQVRPLSSGEAATGLRSYEGRPMVLNLWAPWCPPCRLEMPDFDEVATARRDEVRIVGLATGTEEPAATKFAAEVGVSYELLYDVDDRALDALGVSGLPATLFVDADGRIVETHAGLLTAEELDAKITNLLSRG